MLGIVEPLTQPRDCPVLKDAIGSTWHANVVSHNGLLKLIKVLFIWVRPINDFVAAKNYKLFDQDKNKITAAIIKNALGQRKTIKMKVDKPEKIA